MAKEKKETVTSKYVTKERIDHNNKPYLPGDEIELSDSEAAALTGLISPAKSEEKES